MRYIFTAEVYDKDLEATLAFNRDVIQEERKKYPDRYPKKFLPDHTLLGPLPIIEKDAYGLSFFEPSDPTKQLANLAIRWTPLVKYSFVPMMTEGAGLRFIAFREYDAKDMGAITARSTEIQEERQKYPDRYPKRFLEDHGCVGVFPTLTRDWCTLAFYETDDVRQVANIIMKWGLTGLLKIKSVWVLPIAVAGESLREVAGKYLPFAVAGK